MFRTESLLSVKDSSSQDSNVREISTHRMIKYKRNIVMTHIMPNISGLFMINKDVRKTKIDDTYSHHFI